MLINTWGFVPCAAPTERVRRRSECTRTSVSRLRRCGRSGFGPALQHHDDRPGSGRQPRLLPQTPWIQRGPTGTRTAPPPPSRFLSTDRPTHAAPGLPMLVWWPSRSVSINKLME